MDLLKIHKIQYFKKSWLQVFIYKDLNKIQHILLFLFVCLNFK